MVPMVRLERLKSDDAQALLRVIDDETALRVRLPCPFTMDHALNFILSYHTYGIKYNNNKELIGALEIKSSGETAYVVAKGFRNKGVCTEALKLAKYAAKRDHGITKLWCMIHPANEASLRVAQKTGLEITYEKKY
jgi:hypothetical protein